MKKTILYLTLFITLLLIGGYWWLTSSNNYQTDGVFEIAINDAPIKINRDENGIAYIFAENKADVIRGQGFVMAQDRLFQIEFYRAIIKGELSAIMGRSMIDFDIKSRVINVPQYAKNNFKYLNQQSKEFLKWYCEGFNAYLNVGKSEFPIELDLLGLTPKKLTTVELLSFVYYIGNNHGQNINDEILSLNLAATMDNAADLLPLNINPDRTKTLEFPSNPLTTMVGKQTSYLKTIPEPLLPFPKLGSNNWVVAGKKTTSGKPIVANDPHLDARTLPGIFYPIGLFCPDFKGVGVGVPGLPGLMIGRNEYVAFGVTNGYGDSQDLFIEDANKDTYLENGQQVPFITRKEIIKVKDSLSVEIEVRSTVRGPIISDFDAFGIIADEVVSFRSAVVESQRASLGVEQFLETKNSTEFGQALEDIDLMFFNFVYADIHGNIAHQSTGLIPQRNNNTGRVPQTIGKEDSWNGFIPKDELPNIKNPERGWVGTANHDTRPDDYPHYYSSHFSPNYRYQRMKEVLSKDKPFDANSMWELILDCKNKQAEQLTPIFIEALKKMDNDINLAQLLADWNYYDNINEVGASVYHMLYNQLIYLILNDELPDNIEDKFWNSQYYWGQKIDSIIINNTAFIDDITTPNKETLETLIIKAGEITIQKLTERLGADATKWTWGRLHTVHFFSPLRKNGFGSTFLGAETFPKNGSNETLNRAGYAKTTSADFESKSISSFRMVADLNDSEKIRAVVSGGSASRVFHVNYKSQLEVWKNETWIPYWFTKEKVLEHSTGELILK